MRDETLVKIVAILAITAIEICNLFTVRWDGHLLFAIGTLIGGIAGYEFGRRLQRRWRR